MLGSAVVNKVGKIKNLFKAVKMHVACIVKGIEMETGLVGELIKGNSEKTLPDGELTGAMLIPAFGGVTAHGVPAVDLRR